MSLRPPHLACLLVPSVFLACIQPARAVLPTPTPVPSIVYRSDETDATAIALSNQPQFSGTGIVYNGDNTEQGTGEAIAPSWILTAKHVVTGYTTASFKCANGQLISGTVYTDAATDMALINLATPLQTTYGGSYTPVALITPNVPASKVQPVGPLIWNVGYGDYGNYGGTVNNLDDQRRGGTNVVDSYGSTFLYFSNNNTSGTEFECSTGPGDSGGPMFLQTAYQWRVCAEVNGAGSNGFQDTDTTASSFIATTTGITFAPQAAPTSLTWNTNYLSPSTAASKSVTAFADGAGNWDTTRLDFVGATTGGDTYTYAWQSSSAIPATQNVATPLPVTFGHGSGAAGTVTLTTPITVGDMTFVAPGSGSYTIAGTSTNLLTMTAAGSSITVNTSVTPTISAPLAGTGAVTKLGAGTLTLTGTNTFSGGTNVNVGKLAVGVTGALGTSGNIAVASGATLDVSALGTTTGYALASGRTLTDNGTITGLLGVSGTLQGTGTVTGGLTVNSGGVVGDTSGTLTVGGAITNSGTIRFTGGATFNASGATSFVNNGVIDALTGNVQLPANFTNASGGTVLTASLVRVKTVASTGSAVTLTIDSYTGHTYQLQRSSTPTAAGFANLGSAQTGSTGTTLTFTDSSPQSGQGFYRVTLTP